ncbi:hypothetical protein GCM10017708_17720 [Arthrobacter citreus]
MTEERHHWRSCSLEAACRGTSAGPVSAPVPGITWLSMGAILGAWTAQNENASIQAADPKIADYFPTCLTLAGFSQRITVSDGDKNCDADL